MIDGKSLLRDLQKLVTVLEEDLRERCGQVAELDEALRAEWQSARDAKRTAEAYVFWRDSFLTQAAVAWVLGTVFVRFLEDNDLLDKPRLSGPGHRRARAKDQRTLFFQDNPTLSDREYLESVFRQMLALPPVAGLFDERHNPLWRAGLSGDGATKLLEFWQRVDPDTGAIAHDFTDAGWDTRFLGDLYQDLSEAVRKRYALLQTPEFVEKFILDRTLTPAIEEFGWQEVRLIDPACGSGHFLLGAFTRLYDLWVTNEPGTSPRDLTQRALDQVAGVDVNPYAVAIAWFRLLLAALKCSGIGRLADAPAFSMNIVCGDSLLHGGSLSATSGPTTDLYARDTLRHVYETEDRDELARVLGRRYHAVVGNPPYITVKDKALNQAYRDRYGSCHGKYSLAVPFMERLFELAESGGEGQSAGYVGMITASSFMKREFGKKVIEKYIPRWDLTHVVDTSSAGPSLEGHGTPTVILFGRHRRPTIPTVRAVMGIRSETETYQGMPYGPGWTAILDQVDESGSESQFVSVADTEREKFHSHPWSIGGGGAAELKEVLEEAAEATLGQIAASIGIAAVTGEDDLYMFRSASDLARLGLELSRPLLTGDRIRDWSHNTPDEAIWLYETDLELLPLESLPAIGRLLWMHRARLSMRKRFGTPMLERGLSWYEWQELYTDKLRTPLSIAFAEVATHNHFVLDRGGKVFKQTAPVIKLRSEATEDDHVALLGLLNSSAGEFWVKQVVHCKGSGGIGGGIASENWEKFYARNASAVSDFPAPEKRPIEIASALDTLGQQLREAAPEVLVRREVPSPELLKQCHMMNGNLRSRGIALQEELDWECYQIYGLLDGEQPLRAPLDEVPGIDLGQRAFEIVMGRKMAAGELETAWFERHGSVPITQIPSEWPEAYRRLVERRIEAIETNRDIGLIEQPEYKRRWNTEPWEEQLVRALREWLLHRLEDPQHWPSIQVVSCATLADRLRADTEFMGVAKLYRIHADFNVAALVTELVESEAVPFLPVLRYKSSGLTKRGVWQDTWALQRREDAGEDPGDIPVPPKYSSTDFRSSTYWRLRGKLDVPKEQFIIYPHCERESDPTSVIGWAGWDHLQQARALSSYYVQMKDQEGWSAERLTPLLGGLLELEAWLLQWHNDIHPEYGVGMGDYFRDFVREEARGLGLTVEEIRAWEPCAKAKKKTKKT